MPRVADPPGARGLGSSSTRILWLALGLLLGTRALAALAPNMWGWGFGVQRFVAPALGWTLWALAALALLPPLSRRALPALTAAGRLGASRPALLAVAAAAGAAALVWSMPDRVRFVGDYLLRFGAVERALPPAVLFPQALPLDVALHHGLPRLLDDRLGWDVNFTARVIGAAEAAALAVLAIGFAAALGLRGALAVTVAAVVFFGGYLGMFTGYGKPIAEIALLTAAVAVLGLRVLRDGRGLVPLGAAVAVGLLLHRSAVGLLPAFAWCAWVALRSPAPEVLRRRPLIAVAVGLPILALAIVLPRVVTTLVTLDPAHFNPAEARRAGGIVAAMFGGARAIDLINLVALVSPLALAMPFLGRLGRTGEPGREGALLSALALPWVAVLLLVHPQQGSFRDWDVFAAAGVTFSLFTAWRVSRAIEGAPTAAWLCVPVVLGVVAPAAQWLAHNADLERGLERIEAFVHEPPARSADERAKTWDFLGIRYAQLGRWERSAEVMREAATLAPSPRVLLQWASAEQERGNTRGAAEVYRRVVVLAPDDYRGWRGLALATWRLGEMDECRRAAHELLRLRPGDREASWMMAESDRLLRRLDDAVDPTLH